MKPKLIVLLVPKGLEESLKRVLSVLAENMSELRLVVIDDIPEQERMAVLKSLFLVKPVRHHKRWTARELGKLKECIAGKKSWQEIAFELHRTIRAVRSKAYKSGLIGRRRHRTGTSTLEQYLPANVGVENVEESSS